MQFSAQEFSSFLRSFRCKPQLAIEWFYVKIYVKGIVRHFFAGKLKTNWILGTSKQASSKGKQLNE
jgi:hypothetical protein